jgi:hypothetical protein
MTQDKMKQDYNKSLFATKPIDYWVITADRGKKHRVALMNDGSFSCSCFAKNKCFGIKQVEVWQEAEKKDYQY